MKAKRLAELQDLIASDGFRRWWKEMTVARSDLAVCISKYEWGLERLTTAEFRAEFLQKTAIDTLYLSGESEDASAQYNVRAAEMENESIQAVGAFEEQRFRASDAWIRLGAIEKSLEEARDALDSVASTGETTSAEAGRLRTIVERTQREREAASEAYAREERSRDELWRSVESLWGRSLQFSLLHREKQAKAKRVKKEAEEFFYEAEQSKKDAARLRREAEETSSERERLEARMSELKSEAERLFQCVAGDDFLYWGSRENDRVAYCVPLIGDDRNFNLEVRPLTIYRVTAKEGVLRLELIPPEGVDPEEGDRRIESYFLGEREAPAAAEES